MARDTDVVVIGGGVVGLACAAALARAGRDVLLCERHDDFARETTSRNSEVIHAGIYYPKDSLKALLCTAGREALYERCEARRIPHRRIGKLIVATDDAEAERLGEIRERAEANGVPGLRVLEADELARAEPAVRAVAALESPSTGIVDAHALSLSYAAEAEEHGAVLLRHTEVTDLEPNDAGWRVTTTAEGERTSVSCGAVVNAAGLAADTVAALAGLDVDALGYRQHPCKGDYFSLAPGAPLSVSRLIYPVPAGPGLGIHATLDLGGRIRFGPDAEFVDSLDLAVDGAKAEGFAAAIRRYLPDMKAEWLSPDYAGIRPRLAGPGESFRDFVVAEESGAGLPGLVNCIGIESPGLTAAGAIADRVVGLLAGL